jgi:hypothetical protein
VYENVYVEIFIALSGMVMETHMYTERERQREIDRQTDVMEYYIVNKSVYALIDFGRCPQYIW